MEKRRVLEDALHVLATEHHALECSVGANEVWHFFSKTKFLFRTSYSISISLRRRVFTLRYVTPRYGCCVMLFRVICLHNTTVCRINLSTKPVGTNTQIKLLMSGSSRCCRVESMLSCICKFVWTAVHIRV